MTQKSRFNSPGIPQHIIQRGNNRAPWFFAEPDYQRYLEDLAAAADKYHCRIHAYVLMTNHVHLLEIMGQRAIVSIFKGNGCYLWAQYK